MVCGITNFTLIKALNISSTIDYFKCVFPQVCCVLVQSEPSCDQTEFLHPNGTCVACSVCGPGEELSEVTRTTHYSVSTIFPSLTFFPLPVLLLGSKSILFIILRTVVLEMVVKVSVFCVKKGSSVQIQV